jgi:hypothetical protein
MELEVEAFYTHYKKPTRKWTQSIEGLNTADNIIQTLITIAQEEGDDALVIATVFNNIALYFSAVSTLEEVRTHYDKALGGGMKRA